MTNPPLSRIHNRRLHNRISAFVMLVLVCLLLCMPAAAHSPSAMTLAFDPSAETISVTITHEVPDPATHYIRNVEVRVNDVIVSNPVYTGQPTTDTFTYSYNVNARAGDTIRVTATCVLVGSVQRVYTVPEPTGSPVVTGTGPTTEVPPLTSAPPTTSPGPSPTSAPAGLLPLFGAGVILLFRKK